MFRRLIKDYFTFSNAERKGIIILVIFIFLSLAFRLVLPRLTKQSHNETAAFDAEVHQWLNDFNENETVPVHSDSSKNIGNTCFNLFNFDPNVISTEDLKKLGVKRNVIKAWINYRARGGKFYRKEDLKKIYGLDSVTFSRLEPYVITETEYNQRVTRYRHAAENKLPIELNKATETEFERLNGIGQVLARRIIKYRNLLGGYCSISQLSEVYGITDSIVLANASILSVDKSRIEKININMADFRKLSGHPYISDYEAKALIHYREMKGDIQTFNELVINNLISDSTFTKLADYLVLKE
jgi:competence protein ComEA